jgi:hypothetical protein
MAFALPTPAPQETPAGTGAGGALALVRLRSALPEELRSRLKSAGQLARERRDERERREGEPVATAFPALDRLLEGGLPRGQLVELVGSRTSGRFSALLAALAAATSVGEAAALVDLGDGLSPATAAALGLDLERLLWMRPASIQDALAAAELAVGAGFPLVALDLGNPPLPGGRGAESFWLRLARAARDHGSALLVSSPYRVSGTAAAAVLKAERGRAAWQGGGAAPRLLAGVASRLVLEKHRGRPPGLAEGFALTVGDAPIPAAPVPLPEPTRARKGPKPAPRRREESVLAVAGG